MHSIRGNQVGNRITDTGALSMPCYASPDQSSSEPIPDAPVGSERQVAGLDVRLFGRLCIVYEGKPVDMCIGSRAQELLCYLLLHRQQPHLREGVASTLWGDQCTTATSKTYLRKALWQLQSSLQAATGPAADIIQADREWIRVVSSAPLRLDVATLEEACVRVRDVPGAKLSNEEADLLRAAASVYASDLLDGWYQDWCLVQRERLRQVYLLMLDKLMAYSEHVGACETGLAYGENSLRCDRARERTYRQLIRLHHTLGDRTGALRMYERCVATIREELDTAPSAETIALIDTVRGSTSACSDKVPLVQPVPMKEAADVTVRLERLVELQRQCMGLHERVLSEIEAIGRVLRRSDDRGIDAI